ncbi:hypothetical protein FC70_GL000931 [Paucilactobacillus oligofermentans DSM 15707 = LMG 22743]|uniref:Flavodoxin-like fold domain-containing protein n=1 Tax=Paucilactobacillus oligofermentans DSM 15707 = LMG 22743 TaxID=1423778 RepID=A0A0R1REM7_9LACO|nr:NAD(P)H-dependent oxidoreductase [Paucilactobacillus oligofermentans]KRL55335.1 hypothetical protein FC70_GL000931 [Paucilactobacillus oligofermentans DSM 15707 = LMG 22743]CUS25674.1 Putative NAD(P)H dehydrogenase [Paucilactobacillus oligofermentans DSM 15707 = LMG 22743]
MLTTIIYAHPYQGSFNHAILKKVEGQLLEKNRDFKVIDLYQDKFDPIYSTEELNLFNSGKTSDSLVKGYQKALKDADQLIFIFPIWWNDLPGMVKGFVDKVFKMNFAYVDGNHGVKGLLTNINQVNIFTTSKSPNWYIKLFAGNAIKSVFIKSTLQQVGIRNVKWNNFGQISKSDNLKREQYLSNIRL